MHKLITALATSVAVALCSFNGTAATFLDPLDTPAAVVSDLTKAPLLAVERIGQRLIAAGQRGLIIVSDDNGQSWQQSISPVSSDLLAIHFVNAEIGWIVGHDGVVLHTTDGAKTWQKQLDGREAESILSKHFEASMVAGEPNAESFLQLIKVNYAAGPEQPWLDVWFANEKCGFIVGSFGLIMATQDGGQSWQSWIENVDDTRSQHFNAITSIGDDVFIASERGTVYRLDKSSQHFVPSESGYQGSFFGLTGTADNLLAFGLRGTVYRSQDHGAHWTQLKTGVDAGLNGGKLMNDGRVVLVTQDGRLTIGDPTSAFFYPETTRYPMLLTDAAPAGINQVVITGLGGLRIVRLPNPS